jgi:ribosome-associated protein
VDDLHVPPGPGAPRGLRVPAGELVEQFSHASGPGGQGVNTTDSRVELSVDLRDAPLRDEDRTRVLARLAGRLHDGVLTVVASEDRSQRRNRRAARQRLAALLRDALAPAPPERRPTSPSRAARRRRVDAKKRTGAVKQLRRPPTGE